MRFCRPSITTIGLACVTLAAVLFLNFYGWLAYRTGQSSILYYGWPRTVYNVTALIPVKDFNRSALLFDVVLAVALVAGVGLRFATLEDVATTISLRALMMFTAAVATWIAILNWENEGNLLGLGYEAARLWVFVAVFLAWRNVAQLVGNLRSRPT